METIELEKTYLAKYIPRDLEKMNSIEIADTYYPKEKAHPSLRLRQRGAVCEMTKKRRVDENDSSKQIESTIELDGDEYAALVVAPGRRVVKRRYLFPFAGRTAEVDVFLEDLSGLVLVDFEFDNESDKDSFVMPDFCLADVTEEDFIAGGIICGKSYADIQDKLNGFGYTKLSL